MIGHLLGAAGAVECIVTVKSIQDGFIHQTVGTRECDEECDLTMQLAHRSKKRSNVRSPIPLDLAGTMQPFF